MANDDTLSTILATFVDSGLHVEYRASSEPQELRIDIRASSRAQPSMSVAPNVVRFAAKFISQGLAAGAEFAPWSSEAKVVSGPTTSKSAGGFGPDYSWSLTVAAMSPRFLPYLVEKLAALGDANIAESLSIVGTLPPDRSPLSATTADVRGWLKQCDARPGAWPEPGFSVVEEQRPKGAAVRLVMADAVGPALLERFEDLLTSWSSVIINYCDSRGKWRGQSDFYPRLASSNSELTANYGTFDYIVGPSRDALLNGLAWFHRAVAPIREAHIAL